MEDELSARAVLRALRSGALAAVLVPLTAGVGHAQDSAPRGEDIVAPDTAMLEEMSFEDLMTVDIETNVASRGYETQREAPAVLTVITREQILASHARDLLDVLALVPGFVPAWDVGAASPLS